LLFPHLHALVSFLTWNMIFVRSLDSKHHSLSSQAQHDFTYRQGAWTICSMTQKLLMLPFSTLAGQFPRLVRDLCRDQARGRLCGSRR